MPENISTQFDSELNSVSSRVMELGGLVESANSPGDLRLVPDSAWKPWKVASIEQRVNAMEVEIDHELSSIIARRQPTARDLRLLIAFSRPRPTWSAWATGAQDGPHGQVHHREAVPPFVALQRPAHGG